MNSAFRKPRIHAAAWAWLRTHPWWALSIALHAALVVGVLMHGGWPGGGPGRPPLSAADHARIEASVEQARRRQMHQHLRSLEAIERELAGPGPGPQPPDPRLPDDPQALLQRALEAAARIEQAEQRRRAAELSRLTGLPPEQALARVRAQPPVPRPTHAPPEQALRELERQARAAQARRADEQARQRDGARVAGGSGAGRSPSAARAGGGGGASDAGPLAADGGRGMGRGSGPGDERAGGALESTSLAQEPRVYGVMRQSQRLDEATLRPAVGRRIGRGAPLATRVLLDGWYVAGPFAARGAQSLHDPYPPEIAVDLDAAYAGQDGRLLEWRWMPAPTYPWVPPHRAENAVYYAWTELHVDHEQDVVLEIGADDDSKLWLNDELVWVSDLQGDKPWYRQPFYLLEPEIRQLNLVEAKKLVRLRAGRNTLLLKLYNGIDLMFFSVVVTAPG